MKKEAPKPNLSVMKGVKKKLKQIENVLFPTLKEVFTKYNSIIKDANTQKQLFDLGQDANTTSLGDYAESTKRIKIRKRQPIDRVTLKDTGAFYENITVKASDTEVIIEASISYAKWLTKKYGKDILGVQNMFLKDFVLKYVFPELETEIHKIIVK